MFSPDELFTLAQKAAGESHSFFAKNKKKLIKADRLVQMLHEEAFEKTDCLQCANCCRSLGPAMYDKDIERMSKALRIKPSEVVTQYLRKDEDGDYVFRTMPCPFLMPDNYCSIYEYRPKACREYPHTDRKKFYQIFKLTVRNTYTCPVAYKVIEDLKKRL
ncbi:MAG: YkgJ family cysteine cluster protein [Candidatus Azobacteroides sp.]|nr:YkgJ family cysteine cluster protein [Candidatus Azobacteroides sp.]